ncbi:MAG TPA: glutamate racemase, partial [Sphingobacteriaceae bacterium]|nr:glutamate racemase [Sphingobacteriaceae bacterium]
RYTTQLLAQDPEIDTVILGCTHYPLIAPLINEFLPEHIHLLPQGELVANSLEDYMRRHPEVEAQCRRGSGRKFLTTDDPKDFASKAELFFGSTIQAEKYAL